MAKASQSDVDAVRDFFQALESKLDYWETTDESLGQWLETAYPTISSAWERILLGYEVLVTNACDPTLTYLDYKPEIKQALTQQLMNDLTILATHEPSPP